MGYAPDNWGNRFKYNMKPTTALNILTGNYEEGYQDYLNKQGLQNWAKDTLAESPSISELRETRKKEEARIEEEDFWNKVIEIEKTRNPKPYSLEEIEGVTKRGAEHQSGLRMKENEQTYGFELGLQNDQQAFTSGENRKNREFTAGENQKERDFTGAQNELDRQHEQKNWMMQDLRARRGQTLQMLQGATPRSAMDMNVASYRRR